MSNILIELTDRCNLNCRHCFGNRHGGHDEIQLPTNEKIIGSAHRQGFDSIVFTGGEPTLHSQFTRIVSKVHEAGYRFGFVSNGQNFVTVYPQIKSFMDQIATITFSLDGATAQSHDRLRGSGAFTKLMKAVSICVAKAIPFTFNSVITNYNIDELESLVGLAQQLGSSGLRFGQLSLTPSAMDHGLAIAPEAIDAAAESISQFQSDNAYPIALAPGFYTSTCFPCSPLQMAEPNISQSGQLSLCCQLPDHGDTLMCQNERLDLNIVSFEEAYDNW